MAEAPGTSSAAKSPTKKGILKHGHEGSHPPEIKWDEMNILETYHPTNKDYGHMKIDEPPTPYNHEFEDDEGTSLTAGVCSSELTDKLTSAGTRSDYTSDDDEDVQAEKNLSPEAKAKKSEFKSHRKQHYNEFQSVKKARELIEKELAELEKEEEGQMDTN